MRGKNGPLIFTYSEDNKNSKAIENGEETAGDREKKSGRGPWD
jgi:hypothetical protein